MKNDHPVLPYLLLILAACLWSGNIITGRAMHDDIPPLTLTFLRWTLSFIILLPLCLGKFREDLPVIRRHWKWLLLISASGIAIFHSFVYTGLSQTTAINAGLMMASSPIIIPIIAYLIHRDGPSTMQSLGIVASLIGVGIIITRGDPAVLGNLTFNPGDLWILAAMPVWGFYTVLLKGRPKELSSRAMMLTITGMGSLILLPFYVWEFSKLGGIAFSTPNVVSIAYVSMVASVIAYFAWNKGVAELGAIKSGQFLQVIPVCTVLLAMAFLGETLQPFHFAGIALIVGGIVLSSRKSRTTS